MYRVTWLLSAVSAFSVSAASNALTCERIPNLTTTLGPYSPAAIKAGVVPALKSQTGLSCPTAILTLLGNNSVSAKFHSQNDLKLVRQGGTETIDYAASVAPDGSFRFAQNTSIDYMQNNLLNLLDLLGGSSASLPVYIRPSNATTPLPGTRRRRRYITASFKR